MNANGRTRFPSGWIVLPSSKERGNRVRGELSGALVALLAVIRSKEKEPSLCAKCGI
jgi:hypothetical protein